MYLTGLSFQNVQPNPGTPGVAAPSGPASAPGPAPQSASNPLVTLLPLVIFIPFFFMMFRRNKKEQEARSKLKKGDRVVSSGLVGELVEMDERFAKVKLGPGITVQMLATAVQPLDASAAMAKADDKDLKDLKDAKAAADKK